MIIAFIRCGAGTFEPCGTGFLTARRFPMGSEIRSRVGTVSQSVCREIKSDCQVTRDGIPRLNGRQRVEREWVTVWCPQPPSPETEGSQMPDPNNPGQFGNREDTEEQASKGGKSSSGSFGESNGADPHEAGRKGAAAQPQEAKVKGGQRSHGGR